MPDKTLSFGEGRLMDDDAGAYTEVIQNAVDIHLNKEAIRDGLWKDYPARDQCYQIKVKADRIKRTLERCPVGGELKDEETANVTEELLDIINYCVFAVRKVQGIEMSREV